MTHWRWFLSFVLGVGLSLGSNSLLRAESASSAPVALKTLINQIDTAANSQDLQKLMALYSPQFVTDDGLMSDSYSQALTGLWKRYPNLKYTTDLLSWDKTENAWTAETLTTVEGTSKEDDRVVQLKATIKSRQTFEDGKLVRQEILEERTELTSGSNPPQIEVKLPETVRVGQEFDFDVIVKEPLNDNLLAGIAIGEKIASNRYLEPSAMELQLLQAGGIFKRIKASENPENHWFSALLVRPDGMVLVTQRVRFQP
ncbi:MAG TPA: hypothetical protein DCF68_05615 [Cyanothece sp. UBA12306]|nr:hypothetical protein [Cyanothece sp. UBA12306]